MLGPRARSWFNFVSDFQIKDKMEKLSDYKVLYVPDAIYQDEDTVNMIKSFVKRGGVLVLNNPEAFRWRPDGTERIKLPVELMGISVIGKLKDPGSLRIENKNLIQRNGLTALANMAGKNLPVFSREGFELKVYPKAKTIATFDNNKPAIVINKFGKGKVITFASTPFHESSFANSGWWDFFKALQIDLKCKVDHKIWRFKFPLAKNQIPQKYPEDKICLTGNACYWDQERIVKAVNANIKFNYNYSILPDLIKEEVSAKVWNEKNGDLFDRSKSMKSMPVMPKGKNKKESLLIPWAVAWNQTDVININLNFEKSVAISELRLWVSGEIPSIKIFSKQENEEKQIGGISAYGDSCQDVREIHIQFSSTKSDSFIIRFDKRKAGKLYLSELELWGNLQ
jgi:hypothetical protein